MTAYLELDDLLILAHALGVPHVRDIGLLDSAAHRPRTSLYGEDAYSDIDEKAAVLLESIVRNHALIDGNKRLAWLATMTFYRLNGHAVHAPGDPAYDLVIAAATGTVTYREVAAALREWRKSG